MVFGCRNNGGVDRQELVSHKVAVGGTFVSPKVKELRKEGCGRSFRSWAARGVSYRE